MEDPLTSPYTDSIPLEPSTGSLDSQPSSRSVQFEFLSYPSENADIIKLYDASGREFPTNLRTSDVQYLLKQTYLNNLKASMLEEQKMKARAKNGPKLSSTNSRNAADRHSRTASSKLESVLHRALPSNTQNDRSSHHSGGSGSSSWNASASTSALTKDGNTWAIPNPIPHGTLADRLKCEESFSADDYIPGKSNRIPAADSLSASFSFANQISLANLEKSFPPALAVAGSKKKNKAKEEKLTVKIKLPKPQEARVPSTSRAGKRERGKRCRKVYGNANRSQWCRMCQWKKSCERFNQEPDEDDDEPTVEPNTLSASSYTEL